MNDVARDLGPLPTVDPATLGPLLLRESRRLQGLVRAMGDAGLGRHVPGLAWTGRQVADHLLVVQQVFADTLLGHSPASSAVDPPWHHPTVRGTADLPARVAAVNALMLPSAGTGDAHGTADALAARGRTLAEAIARLTDHTLDVAHPVPWYGEHLTLPACALAALGTSETLVHSRDLAVAAGRGWRVPHDAADAVAGVVMSRMLPLLLSPERAGDLALGIDVHVGRQHFVLRIEDGRAWAEPTAGQDVDARLHLRPSVALLLGHRRTRVARAVLSGGLRPSGRRPWATLAISRVFLAA